MAFMFTRLKNVRLFLHGYLKSKAFQDNPVSTTETLKERLQLEVVQILQATLRKVMNECLQDLLGKCPRLNGRHLTEVIFKTHPNFLNFPLRNWRL